MSDVYPDDFFLAIALHMRTCDIMKLACTCKRLNELLNDNDVLWKHCYYRDFPDPQLKDLSRFGINEK